MKVTRINRRGVWVSAMLAVAGALAVTAALAYACTVQPTVNLGGGSAAAGSTVSGTGEFFSKTGGPVELHFNSLDSAVVWSGQPDAVGRIAFQFQVPPVDPGDYTIVATQTSLATGQPVAGTPSRAPLTVLAAASPAPQAPAGTPGPRGPQPGRDRGAPLTRNVSPAPDSQPTAGKRSGRATTDPTASTGSGPAASDTPATPTGAGVDSVLDRSRSKPGSGSSATGSSATPAPSERSVTSDVWAGVKPGGRASLVPGDRDSVPASDGGSPLALAWGLLGIGLVGLMGGFLLATARRRRKAEQGRVAR